MPDPVTLTPRDGGAFVELRLTRPPRNLLDLAALDALAAAAETLRGAEHRHAHAVLLCADGPHFSVGASVAEHARAQAPAMLARFHRAVLALLDVDLPLVAAVRGQCLGGGLELAMLAARIFAHPSARLGQPEIRLGALAPVASLVLPRRLGQAVAEDLLVSGRVLDAAAAASLGVVTAVAEDPDEAGAAWIRDSLGALSASSLRLACRAARLAMRRELAALLPELERLYITELSATADAEEGVRAFLAKRPPRWEDR
jgi:cyclohexa-1,5-dienecarbonyl-CoA hydratase